VPGWVMEMEVVSAMALGGALVLEKVSDEVSAMGKASGLGYDTRPRSRNNSCDTYRNCSCTDKSETCCTTNHNRERRMSKQPCKRNRSLRNNSHTACIESYIGMRCSVCTRRCSR